MSLKPRTSEAIGIAQDDVLRAADRLTPGDDASLARLLHAVKVWRKVRRVKVKRGTHG